MFMKIAGTMIRLFILYVASSFLYSQTNLTNHDGYIRREGNEWILGTSLVERRVQLINGQFLLVSLRNKKMGREYGATAATQIAEIKLSVGGEDTSSPTWKWTLRNEHAIRGSQGELQLDIELESGKLQASKHYVVYPGTAIIREWWTVKNVSDKPIHLGQVSFLNAQASNLSVRDLQFNYLTGGGNYTGSQLLKTEPITSSYHHTFDSNGGMQPISYSSYLPLAFVQSQEANAGVAIGWDYLGHWLLDVGKDSDSSFVMRLELAGYEKTLAPGKQMETPKAFVAAYSGGVDELGNQLLDWQYEYLWEFTNPDYFAKTRWAVDWPDPWGGEGGTPSVDNWGRRLALDLRYVDLLRETGTDILWDDAGWYDKWGSWAAPDWKRTVDYLRKHDMKWVLWWPTFLATPESRIAQQHPEWIIPGQKVFEQSISATADWQAQLLDKSVSEWGDYQWRYDIAPAASGNDTDLLAADQNFRRLLEQFKTKHPQSGVDACHNGGRWISYDLARLAESGEYTDGGVGPYSAYYSSLIVPPDKLHNVVDFDHIYYISSTDRTHLSMNPTWYRDPGDGPDVEAIRKDWELYHYLIAQGVAGRWSHVFRPKVENDDPVWYFQRMNRDGSKGVILTKHAKQNATYFLTTRLKTPGPGEDRYRGGAGDMNMITTTSAAEVSNAIYEDPVDGAVRYYGAPGQSFGPLNIKYQDDGEERSLVAKIVRLGADKRVDSKFFGMELHPNGPLTITQLGQFEPGINLGQAFPTSNRGIFTLSVIRAENGAVLATADLDMSQRKTDEMGFKYVRLSQPLHLETAIKPIVIYPRGLSANETYDVRAIHSGLRLHKTGAELMSQGINLEKIAPGELIFLNLPNYPGSGTDHIAPSAPGRVTKRPGANLGVQGVEISWSTSHDDNWLSYYEVCKNGTVIGKAAKGTFYFDHSDSARDDIDAAYEVRAVDGDGNRSAFVAAQKTVGDPQIYEALGDFSAVQFIKQWVYEEQIEDGLYRPLRWDKSGYEGRWTGSGLGKIGRIWMQPSANYDLSRTFITPASGTISTIGTIRKDPSAENAASVFVRILRNSEPVWPAQGWAELKPDYDFPTNYEVSNLEVAAGDKIRFVVKHNGQNRADPILWNPRIVMGNPPENKAAVFREGYQGTRFSRRTFEP